MTGRVIVGLLWLAMLAVVVQAWSAGAARSRVYTAAPGTGTTLIPGDTVHADAFHDRAASKPLLDLYGNEIDDAVGDYRIDVRGDIYELHSPDTAVTHLTAPSM